MHSNLNSKILKTLLTHNKINILSTRIDYLVSFWNEGSDFTMHIKWNKLGSGFKVSKLFVSNDYNKIKITKHLKEVHIF